MLVWNDFRQVAQTNRLFFAFRFGISNQQSNMIGLIALKSFILRTFTDKSFIQYFTVIAKFCVSTDQFNSSYTYFKFGNVSAPASGWYSLFEVNWFVALKLCGKEKHLLMHCYFHITSLLELCPNLCFGPILYTLNSFGKMFKPQQSLGMVAQELALYELH